MTVSYSVVLTSLLSFWSVYLWVDNPWDNWYLSKWLNVKFFLLFKDLFIISCFDNLIGALFFGIDNLKFFCNLVLNKEVIF